MEEPPRDYQWAEERLLARGASLVCPVCSKDQWNAPGELANLLGSLALVTAGSEHFRIKDVDQVPVEKVCYAFVCANCGFIRLHDESALEGGHDEPEPS